jgi:predicted Rossmann fold flavoprotein
MEKMQDTYDVIIIGAGAAGMMCAATAGARGKRVLLIDKAKKPGEKIRISGGGRCNFTNIHAAPANYLSANAHFCVSALKRYRPADFIALVEKHGIAYHEKTLGQLFCDDSSLQIIRMLRTECDEAGVQWLLEQSVEAVSPNGDGFALTLKDGSALACASLVIATGGPSIPKMGASGWGYQLAQQFGLNVIPPRAGLVPFTLAEAQLEALRPLAGVSAEVIASCNGTSFREAMLFTHRGLSGPAILQISSYWKDGDTVSINFTPDLDLLQALKDARQSNPKQEIQTFLSGLLAKKLAHALCDEAQLQGRLADCSNAQLQTLADTAQRWQVIPSGTEGWRTAEVALGGVDTDALSSKSMEVKTVPGLYFIGEVVDVTGHLGGYNFQWAWASGVAAGQCV